MPLYEYRCEGCGELFEVIQKFSDPPLATHEKCGGNVQRLLSAPALQFKGSGWYVTDYAKSGNAERGNSDKKTESGTPVVSSTEASGSAPSSSEKKSTPSETKTD